MKLTRISRQQSKNTHPEQIGSIGHIKSVKLPDLTLNVEALLGYEKFPLIIHQTNREGNVTEQLALLNLRQPGTT